MKTILFILLSIIAFASNAQNWELLKKEYDVLVENKKDSLSVLKAKELFNWVSQNENDTSINLPISLKLIGNSYLYINRDSSLFYYNKSLELLKKQNRTSHIQYVRVLYNKSNIYYYFENKRNDSLALVEVLKSIKILEDLNYPEYPFNTWPLKRGALLYYSKGNFYESKQLSLQYFKIKKENLDTVNIEYFEEKIRLGYCYKELNNFYDAELVLKSCLSEIKYSLGEKNELYANCISNLISLENTRGNYEKTIYYYKLELENIKLNFGPENEKYFKCLSTIGLYYEFLKDFKSAIDYYTQAIILADALNIKDKNTTDVLDQLGDIYLEKGEYISAKLTYEKSLKQKIISKDSVNLASSYYNLGICYAKNDSANKSIEFFLKAKLIGDQLKNYDDLYIDNLRLISEYYSEIMFYEEAISYAKLFCDFSKEKYGTSNLIYKYSVSYIGMLYDMLGDYNKADLYFKEFLKLIINDNSNVFEEYPMIKLNMGLHYMNMGNYETAEKIMLECLNSKQRISEILPTLNNLGLLYMSVGSYNKAIVYFEKNITLIDTILNSNNLLYSTSLYNLGLANFYLLKFKIGLNYLLKAKKYIDNHNNSNSIQYGNVLAAIGSCYLNLVEFPKSEEYFTLAFKNFQERKDTVSRDFGMLLMNLGVLNNLQLYTALAETYYNQSLLVLEKSIGKTHPIYFEAQNKLAWLYYYNDKIEEAINEYDKLIKNKSKFINESFTWLSEREKEEFWKKEINFFNQIHLIAEKDTLRPELDLLALKASIFSKGILLESNSTFNKSVSNSNDQSVQSLYGQYNLLKNQFINNHRSNTLNASKLLNDKIDSLQKILVSKVGSDFKKNKNIEIEDLCSNLNENEIALEFNRYYNYFDTTYYYSVSVLNKKTIYPQLIKLCSEKELNSFSPETELNELYNLIWKPLLPALTNIKTIYYSPVGLLNNIPFHSLYNYKDEKRNYVIDNYTLHQLTSTRYLALGLKQKVNEITEASIVLFGGINYNDMPTSKSDSVNDLAIETANIIRDIDDSSRSGASYLPGSKKEVDNIAELLKSKQWNVSLVDGKNASEGKLKSFSEANSKSILHIATHGFAFADKVEPKSNTPFNYEMGNQKYKASDNPMIRCGLLFGGANITWQGKNDSVLNATNDDGILTAYELSQLDLSNTKLTVLSACETGKGAIQGSEGTFGLKRALKLAGVDNIIVSLWKVPDDATMQMMTLFYTELAKTKNPVTSFEFAQKTMRNSHPDEPKKWAGFVFVR